MLTVNWHLEKTCNYACKFCYAHFASIKRNVSLEDGKKLLGAFSAAGYYKVNFAGGEPTLNAHLGPHLSHSKHLGLKTSIISNGSKLTRSWLQDYCWCEFAKSVNECETFMA